MQIKHPRNQIISCLAHCNFPTILLPVSLQSLSAARLQLSERGVSEMLIWGVKDPPKSPLCPLHGAEDTFYKEPCPIIKSGWGASFPQSPPSLLLSHRHAWVITASQSW